MKTQAGIDAIGIRWRRIEVDGLDVMVMVLDQNSLTESPGLEDRVALAAKLCVMELRTDPVPKNKREDSA